MSGEDRCSKVRICWGDIENSKPYTYARIACGPINPWDALSSIRNCNMSEFPITLVFMIIYVGWCAIVISVPEIHETTPDVSQTFNIVGATLAFILPLIAASAVARNKDALNNYNAFCGDVLALGWEVLAYVRDERNNTVNDERDKSIRDLFELCLVLPTLVKWKFREGLDIEKVYMRKFEEKVENFKVKNLVYKPVEGRFRGRFVNTNVGGWFKYIFLKVAKERGKDDEGIIIVKEKGIDECDLIFAIVNKIISDFKTNGDTRKNMLQRTLERVYNSYGNMGNIDAYKLPQVYTVYLYISMFIFVMLFPLNYPPKGGELKTMNITEDGDFEALYSNVESGVVDHDWNIIWHGIILVYFLFGFNFMTTQVGNAFKSTKNAPGYTTVGKSETNVNDALIALYTAKQDFQGTYETLLKRREKIFITKKGLMDDRRVYDEEFDQFNALRKKKKKQQRVDTGSGESKSKTDSKSLLTNRRKLYV
jgi:predicted membrane chloride channel (bestrophin family)